MSVLDEVEGVNRVVRNGVVERLSLWQATATPGRPALEPFFQQMDALGNQPRVLSTLDQDIKAIIASAEPAGDGMKVMPAEVALSPLPRETAVIHRVVFVTHLLEFAALVTIVALGTYVVIWKNPGFGSGGDFLVAFLWGLLGKLGADVARLGPADVRTAYSVHIPTS